MAICPLSGQAPERVHGMETTVRYHADHGRAHPAINVKVYANVRSPEVDAAFPDDLADDLHERAWEDVAERFWDEAEELAAELHMGKIWQEGRQGGWLVFEYDPEHDGEDWTSPEGYVAEWLAGYRQMARWADQYISEVPAEVRNLAQQYGMDRAGERAGFRLFGDLAPYRLVA